jgi:hypothetical protein
MASKTAVSISVSVAFGCALRHSASSCATAWLVVCHPRQDLLHLVLAHPLLRPPYRQAGASLYRIMQKYAVHPRTVGARQNFG